MTGALKVRENVVADTQGSSVHQGNRAEYRQAKKMILRASFLSQITVEANPAASDFQPPEL